jgi:hypothetical protein
MRPGQQTVPGKVGLVQDEARTACCTILDGADEQGKVRPAGCTRLGEALEVDEYRPTGCTRLGGAHESDKSRPAGCSVMRKRVSKMRPGPKVLPV